ncbi:uncharacterized protein A4U43_C03F10110 [Asparagus officinalis]|uniref:Rieske domain-containing protein n=1 Tax=Asparagus officinalis TaxID=4686 RepID=A0A5P1F9K8_ASPOF|nr:uncharacterized protein A4U43_C03F10110 [Asparagus officinalis]
MVPAVPGRRPRQAGPTREAGAGPRRRDLVGPGPGQALSEGRIDQRGRLQCVYHGWCFDGEGSCKYIPQAPPEGPPVHTFPKACAAVYPSYEQNKVLWFWPNTTPEYKDIAEKEKPPYVPELDDPSYACAMGTRDLHYGYDVLIENLMDPAHVPYAHHGIMKIPKRPGGPPPDRYVYLENFSLDIIIAFYGIFAAIVSLTFQDSVNELEVNSPHLC